MAIYTIKAHHNETAETEGETIEFDLSTDLNEKHSVDYTEEEIRLRLLEAQTISLANLAESAERIANALETLAKYRAGDL